MDIKDVANEKAKELTYADLPDQKLFKFKENRSDTFYKIDGKDFLVVSRFGGTIGIRDIKKNTLLGEKVPVIPYRQVNPLEVEVDE